MLETIKQRINAFIKYKGITIKSFEEKCGLSNGYISSMRKGFGTGKLENVLKEFPDLNRDWLLYNEGNMLSDSVSQNVNGNNNHVVGRDINMSNEDFSKLIDTVNKQQEQMGRLISLLENIVNVYLYNK